MGRDNQQGTPTEAEIAWLSGVIESEGSVMLSCYVRKERCKPKIGTEIKLYNTDAGIIHKAVDILERLGVGHYISERQQKPMKMKNGKEYGASCPMLALTVKNLEQAYRLAKIIRPWFFGEKGPRLDLMIQYLARRLAKIEASGNLRVPLDRGDVQIVVDFYRKHVTRPGHNRHLVEGLLNEYEQAAIV
jgi:hypothetical protein